MAKQLVLWLNILDVQSRLDPNNAAQIIEMMNQNKRNRTRYDYGRGTCSQVIKQLYELVLPEEHGGRLIWC